MLTGKQIRRVMEFEDSLRRPWRCSCGLMRFSLDQFDVHDEHVCMLRSEENVRVVTVGCLMP